MAVSPRAIWERGEYQNGERVSPVDVSSHFSVYFAISGLVTKEQTTNWVTLVQACSRPVRRQSLAIQENSQDVDITKSL